MAEENGNGKNGNRVGLLERVKAGVKQDVQSLKTDMPAKAKEQIDLLKDPTKTQVYTSIFRHKHDDTPRNRALGVLSNVFLHLHPAKINRDAVRYSYTWGMGGITFYLFIVLTFTGVLLMFYYHPSKVQAFRDVLYLEHDVPFGKLLRNMHRWAAHLMVIAVWLHMFRVFLTGSYKKPREFNWNIGVLLLVFTLLLSFTGYLLPDDQLGFWAVTVGTNMARATPGLGHEGPFGKQLGMTPYNDVRFGLLGGSIVDANALGVRGERAEKVNVTRGDSRLRLSWPSAARRRPAKNCRASLDRTGEGARPHASRGELLWIGDNFGILLRRLTMCQLSA